MNHLTHPQYYVVEDGIAALSPAKILAERDALAAGNKRQHEKIDKMLGYHVEDKARVAKLEAALKDARYLLGYVVTLDGPDDVDAFFNQVTDRIDGLLPGNDSTQRATLETRDDHG